MKGIVKYDERTICLPRQEVAFLEKARENQGVWEFEEGFLYQIYTNFKGFWAVTWRE